MLVIWLERMEDEDCLPLNELMLQTSTGEEKQQQQQHPLLIILIQPLKSGLFRLKVRGPLNTKYDKNLNPIK